MVYGLGRRIAMIWAGEEYGHDMDWGGVWPWYGLGKRMKMTKFGEVQDTLAVSCM